MKNSGIYQVLSVFFLVGLMTILSCQKSSTPEITPKNPDLQSIPFSVENGVLKFPVFEDYIKMKDFVIQMPAQEVNDWFLSNGLVNLESKYYSLYDELNLLEKEEEIITFVENNPKYLSIEEDEHGEKEVTSTTELLQNYFANEDFIYMINDEVIDIRTHFKTEEVQMRSCGNPQEVIFTVNPSGCKNDRRAKLKIKAVVETGDLSGSFDMLENSMQLRGQRKRGCIWMNYNTELDIKLDAAMTSMVDLTTLSDPPTGVFGCETCYRVIITAQEDVFRTGNTPVILSAHGAGTTRGIGNNFVTLDCN